MSRIALPAHQAIALRGMRIMEDKMNLDIHMMQTENGWYVSSNCHKVDFGAGQGLVGVTSIQKAEAKKFAPRTAVFTSVKAMQEWIAQVVHDVVSGG